MGLLTQDVEDVPIQQAGLPATFGSVIAASAEAAWQDMPLLSAIPRAIELDTARKRYGNAYRNYDQKAATAWIEAQGLKGELTAEDRTYNELELTILARRKRDEIRRREVMQRAEGGIVQGAARLGTAIGVSLLDPLNVASAFIPVVGEERYAAMLAKAGSGLGRAAVRFGVGAVEGGVGAAVIEPIIYASNVQQQADYSLTDSLVNIGFGTIFGGGLHTLAGAVADRGARRAVAEFDRRLQELAPPRVEVSREIPGTVADLPPATHESISATLDSGYAARRAQLTEQASGLLTEAQRVDLQAQSRDLAARIGAIDETTGGDASPLRATLAEVQQRLHADEFAAAARRDLDRLDSRWTRAGSLDERAQILGLDLRRPLFEMGLGETAAKLDARAAELDGEIAAARARLEARRVDADPVPDQVDPLTAGPLDHIKAEVKAKDLATLENEVATLEAARAEAQKVSADVRKSAADSARARAAAMKPETRAAVLKAAIAQNGADQPVRVEGLASLDDGDPNAALDAIRRDADEAAKPDNGTLAEPEAVRVTDEQLAEMPSDELAAAHESLARVEADLKDAQASLDDPEALPAEIRAEIAAAQEFADQADDYGRMARMLVQCALRHPL